MSEKFVFEHDDADEGFRISAGYADGKTGQQVADSSNFPPLGRNDFYPKSVKISSRDSATGMPITRQYDAYVADGEGKFTIYAPFNSYELEITWAWVNDPTKTVKDSFIALPPENEDEMDAYLFGWVQMGDADEGKDDPDKRAGDNARRWDKVKSIVWSLGLPDGDGGRLSDAAQELGNWKMWPDGSPRIASVEVSPPFKRDDKGKFAPDVTPEGTLPTGKFPRIYKGAYKRSDDTMVKLGLMTPEKAAENRAARDAARGGAKSAPKPPAAPKAPASVAGSAPNPSSAPRPPAPAPAAPRPPVGPPRPPASVPPVAAGGPPRPPGPPKPPGAPRGF